MENQRRLICSKLFEFIELGKDLVIKATVELKPEVKLGDFKF